MRYLNAEIIFSDNQTWGPTYVLVLDDENKVLEISTKDQVPNEQIEQFNGWIIPGLVNAHCHLELSHMKGMIPTGTGLTQFIRNVVERRSEDETQLQQAIINADKEMLQQGIVAVGDISNRSDTFETKRRSALNYYTFLEVFDFFQGDKSQDVFFNAEKLLSKYPKQSNCRISISPHAPYSCSPELFDLVDSYYENKKAILSIHNQETVQETLMFKDKTGDIVHLFESYGIDLSSFPANEKDSIDYLMEVVDPSLQLLLVHNTCTKASQIQAAEKQFDHLFWVTCPSANLYIENRLPDYEIFDTMKVKMCVGTDSLASNWRLDVWEEMKTIYKFNSYLAPNHILNWGTINGAHALQWEDELGSFEAGKNPGANLITFDAKRYHHPLMDAQSTIQKIV